LMDCDTTGIEPDIALVKYKLLAGGGMLKIVNQTVKPALEKLGYNAEEIERIIAHIDAFDTIEDAIDTDGSKISSGLKPEHLSIFDCAFKPFRGERSLHYLAHLKMMAAAQPFLSGAISKTVNMPEAATVDDIMSTYIEGWRLGLKSIAIYRDGSKRSAPLNTRKTKDMGTVAGIGDVGTDADALQKRILELEQELATVRNRLDQPVRHRMPDTRSSMTHRFELAGHEGYITVGLYEDGQPGELFITISIKGYKEGTAPKRAQPEWPLKEIAEIEKKVLNRPVTDLARTGDKQVIDVITNKSSNDPVGAGGNGNGAGNSADRVTVALGSIFMGITCSVCGSDKVIRAGACGGVCQGTFPGSFRGRLGDAVSSHPGGATNRAG